jgi:hypothetical protein
MKLTPCIDCVALMCQRPFNTRAAQQQEWRLRDRIGSDSTRMPVCPPALNPPSCIELLAATPLAPLAQLHPSLSLLLLLLLLLLYLSQPLGRQPRAVQLFAATTLSASSSASSRWKRCTAAPPSATAGRQSDKAPA